MHNYNFHELVCEEIKPSCVYYEPKMFIEGQHNSTNQDIKKQINEIEMWQRKNPIK